MKIVASLQSAFNQLDIAVQTNGTSKTIHLPVKSTGYGSANNGGELLLLALATCYCNDIYREAAKRQISIKKVEVVCHGSFGAEGEPGKDFTYEVKVDAEATAEEIKEIVKHTDAVAEVHNTLRKGIEVKLVDG